MENSTIKVSKVILMIIGILTVISCICCVIVSVILRFYNRANQRDTEMLELYKKGGIVHWAAYDEDVFYSGNLMENKALFQEFELPFKFDGYADGVIVPQFDEFEYYDLAEAYLKKNTGLGFDDWALREIQYTLYDCEHGFSGPVTPLYQFVQLNPDLITMDIPLYEIGIIPWSTAIGSYEHNGDLWWGDSDDELMRLQFIPISAQEAYAIAQENGGQAALTDLHLQSCKAFVRFRYGWSDYWIIRYEDRNGPFLIMRIDPATGEFSILQK